MTFDSNRAWKQATMAISVNRDVVFALAGVFFLLPGLAMALLFPTPDAAAASLDGEAAMAQMSEYYVSILPYVVPIVLFQAAGTLAMLTLLTDRSRPTVGEAIGMGIKGIVPYFLSQIILGVAIGLIGGMVIALAAATGVAAIAAIGLAVVAVIAVYGAVKTSLAAPVIAVEGQRNPLEALKRSWRLTSGNSVKIAVFYLLVAIAFMVLIIIATAIIGIVVALIAEAHIVELAGAVISSALNAVMALYFVAIIAATHRQLAGPSPEATSETFD